MSVFILPTPSFKLMLVFLILSFFVLYEIVLKIYFQNPYQLPVFADAIEVAETDLQKYLGVYHCSEIPLKLTISNKGNNLIAQFIGQPSFPLEYAGGNKFQFTPPKITIEFTANEDKLIFKQQDMEFQMYKE